MHVELEIPPTDLLALPYSPGTKVSAYGGRLRGLHMPRGSGEGKSVILRGQRGGVDNFRE